MKTLLILEKDLSTGAFSIELIILMILLNNIHMNRWLDRLLFAFETKFENGVLLNLELSFVIFIKINDSKNN